MYSVFFTSLFSYALPGVLLVLFSSRYRAKAFSLLPLAIAVSFAFVGFAAALTHSLLDYDIKKMVFLIAISALSSWATFEYGSRVLNKTLLPVKLLIPIALLALLFSVDVAWIFSKQHYALDGTTYFRPPFPDDTIRHLVLTNSFIRKGPQPFLPNTPLIFQVFWYYGAASFVAPFSYDFSRLDLLYGYCLTTGVLFFFLLLWAFVLYRPTLLKKAGLVLVAVLCLLHADIYNLILSLWVKHYPGFEADQSYMGSYFRCFTPKLLFLTAPHHTAFFIFFLGYLALTRLQRKNQLLQNVFFLFSFLASPLLSAFAFSILGYRQVKRMILLVGVGCVLHWGVFHFWPHELFIRKGLSGSVDFFTQDPYAYLTLPFLFWVTMGMSGILLFPLIYRLIKQRRKDVLYAFGFVSLILGNLLFQYLVTGLQVRRHFSMVSTVLATIFLVHFLPRTRNWNLALGTTAAFSLIGHFYFLYSYLGKPSHINPSIPWKDYFALNKVIETKFPEMPVIAATDPLGTGINFPISMEVTGTFANPVDTLLFSKITDNQYRYIAWVISSGDAAPSAEKLGYRAIVWGPVEKRLWGERIRQRFIKTNKLLAREGSVELYALSDSLRERLNPLADLNSPDFYVLAAEEFNKDGWKLEAYTYFNQALNLDPRHKKAHQKLADLLETDSRFAEANEHRRLATP